MLTRFGRADPKRKCPSVSRSKLGQLMPVQVDYVRVYSDALWRNPAVHNTTNSSR